MRESQATSQRVQGAVFALTGGIGSGKSTVSALFRSLGVPVVDADQLAREVVAPGSEGLARLVEAFGPELLTDSHELSRPRLAELIFNDQGAKDRVSAILHPLIQKLASERFSALHASGEPLVCYDVPLLFETGQQERFRPVVLVSAPAEEQLRRILLRPSMTEEDARARIAAQWPLSEKLALADIIIDNSGDLDELKQRAEGALSEVRLRLSQTYHAPD